MTRSPSSAVGLSEERRNALLRRADWRFLLPRLRPAAAVCFADGSLAESLPNGSTLRLAWRALEPGATCYTEWRSSWWQVPSRVRRRLERAGFVDVHCYAPRPDPDTHPPGVWLPLDSDAAIRHFLDHEREPATLRRRLVRRVRRALWGRGGRLRLSPTICAVARRPELPTETDAAVPHDGRTGGSRAPGFARAIDGELRRGWSSWGIEGTPDRLSWSLLTGGERSINKVVALGFAGPSPEPRLVVKMARVEEAATALRREAEALRVLEARTGPLPGAPRLLFEAEHDGSYLIGESALAGRPLTSVLRLENSAALARQATEWLTRLAVPARPEPHAAPAESRLSDAQARVVDAAVGHFAASFASVLDPAMLRDTEEAISTLRALPLVHEQRDFSPWNVLLAADGELAVLDWESSEPDGLPMLDLVYFLTYLPVTLEQALDADASRAVYRDLRDPSTRWGSLASDCLATYAQRVGVPWDAAHPLRLLTWMLHSRSEYLRFTADCGGPPPPQVLEQSVFLRWWREELRAGRDA
jgi:hypothetical protein